MNRIPLASHRVSTESPMSLLAAFLGTMSFFRATPISSSIFNTLDSRAFILSSNFSGLGEDAKVCVRSPLRVAPARKDFRLPDLAMALLMSCSSLQENARCLAMEANFFLLGSDSLFFQRLTHHPPILRLLKCSPATSCPCFSIYS